MTKPQQPELRRSDRGQTDQGEWARREEARRRRRERDPSGPVPEANQPGHRPDEEQDRPEAPPSER
ncbi:MAG TPA: hypothetical protein VG709_05800 [Actinomycetota bacterium]|nr:hypothetical protein [Actinomycetota bacterium]